MTPGDATSFAARLSALEAAYRVPSQAAYGNWKKVHQREQGTTPDVVAELRAITDPDAPVSAPMILDVVEDADRARVALAAMYDDPAVDEFEGSTWEMAGRCPASSWRAARRPRVRPPSSCPCMTDRSEERPGCSCYPV